MRGCNEQWQWAWALVTACLLGALISNDRSARAADAAPAADTQAVTPNAKSSSAAPVTAGPQSTVDQTVINRLVAELDSPEFLTRQAASQQLTKMGAAAVEPLLETSRKGSLESAVRAMAVLEVLYCDGDAKESTAAEAALETLSRSKQPSTAARAEVALSGNERLTVERIERFGGIFTTRDDRRLTGEELRAIPFSRKAVDVVLHLGKTWTGNDDGLRYVKRLDWIHNIRIVSKSNGITDDGLAQLTAAVTDLFIHRRGSAKLGVSAENQAEGCLVTQVSAGSSAADADIQPGDLIVKFDGQQVKDFDRLIEMISTKEPGNKVELEFQRNTPGKPSTNVKCVVTLKGWIATPAAPDNTKK